MRILYCSPGYRLKFRKFFYTFDKVLLNGLVRAGHQVKHFSDRDQSDAVLFGWRALGSVVMQQRFLGVAEDFSPDILFLLQTDLLTDSTLQIFKKRHPKALIANIDCDYPLNLRQRRRIERMAQVADATFVTSGGEILREVREFARVAYFVPNPADGAIMAPSYYPDEKSYDLAYPASGESLRYALLDEIAAFCPEMKVLSIGRGGPVFGREFERLLCSARAGLNLSQFNGDLYSSDRIAQLFGFGLCVCIPAQVGYQRFIDRDGAIYFADAEDLGAQLSSALADGNWATIAQRGRAKYLEQFDSPLVAQYLVDVLTGQRAAHNEWASC